MKYLRILQFVAVALFCAASVTLYSCGEDDEPSDGRIQLADGSMQQQQSFASDKLSGQIAFKTAEAWSASIVETTKRSEQTPAPDWISLDRYSGEAGEQTLTITMTPNTTGTDRSADIVITSGGQEIRVSVTQTGTNSGGGTVEDTGEWVEYETLYIMDDGKDHHLPGDQYIFFKEPGFFKGGRSDGSISRLLDMGEMSWKDFSIMETPEYNHFQEGDWTTELVPCVKGHGYFAALKVGNNNPKYARFWVEECIMQSGVMVGAKIRMTNVEFPALLFAREDGMKHEFRRPVYVGFITFKAPQSIIGGSESNTESTYRTYIKDNGEMEHEQWKKILQREQHNAQSEATAFNETDWKNGTEVLGVKGHGYFIRLVETDRETGKTYLSKYVCGVYVLDYIIENGQIVGLVLDYYSK